MNNSLKDTIKQKELFINSVRDFFVSRQVTEVFTKHLSPFAGTDIYIDPLSVDYNNSKLFLHTSP